MNNINELVENIAKERGIDKKIVALIMREGFFIGRNVDWNNTVSTEFTNIILEK